MARDRKPYLLAALATGTLWVLAWPATGSLTPLAFVAWVPLLWAADRYLHAPRTVGPRHRLQSLKRNQEIAPSSSLKEVDDQEDERKVLTERPRHWLPTVYLAMFLWNACTTFWLGLVDEPWGTRLISGGFPMVANSALMVLPWWIYRATHRRLGPRSAPVALVVSWLAFEHLHFDWDLQWPWLTLGNVFAVRTGWVQWYEWTGALGGSLWVWVVNLLVFQGVLAFRQGRQGLARRTGLLALVSVVVPIGLSFIIDQLRSEAHGPAVEVVVVQPNIDPYTEKFGGIDPLAQLEGMLKLAEGEMTDSTRLVVLPETALQENATIDMQGPVPMLNGLWENDLTKARSYGLIRRFQERFPSAAVLTGMSSAYLYRVGEKPSRTARFLKGIDRYFDAYNAAMLVDERGGVQVYHKSKLVVGVELMPFQAVLEPLMGGISIDMGGTNGSLGSGTERPILHTVDDKVRLVPAICYESVFGDHLAEHTREGANLLAVITNDAWWGDSPGYKQHLAFGRLRAIELRRPIARSANTGISCIIDERGDVLQALPWWRPGAIRAQVHTSDASTFFLEHGDVIGRAATVLGFLLALVLVGLWGMRLFSRARN